MTPVAFQRLRDQTSRRPSFTVVSRAYRSFTASTKYIYERVLKIIFSLYALIFLLTEVFIVGNLYFKAISEGTLLAVALSTE